MAGTSFEIVTLLLQYGADPFETDVAGNDPLMFGSIFGHTKNVKLWLEKFPEWAHDTLEKEKTFLPELFSRSS